MPHRNTPANDLRRHDRREFLQLAAAGSSALLAANWGLAAEPADPYGGFKMGLQSYSLRGFDEKTALQHTRTLGVKYWESFPGHIPLSTLPTHIAEQKALLADAGVTLMAYGVVEFDANETKTREKFDFAKAMGMSSFSANPRKDKATFDLLDKMVAEYGVAIAIHNHGPGARYDKIKDVVEIVKDRHPKIGACVDTGHYLRSDENPVEAIEKLGQRVFGVHLKDVRTISNAGKRGKIFTILGQGDLDVLGCLQALRKLKYDLCLALEYEENEKNPLSDIEVSLQAVRDAVKKLA
jgi:sugar phosphate isomerase/epimerase